MEQRGQGQGRKRRRFLSLSTQLHIMMGIGIALLVFLAILFILRRDAAFRSSLAAPLYDARTDTETALAKLGSGKAEIVTRSEDTSFKVKLCFAGVSNIEVMSHILDELDKYEMKAVFFLSGIDAAESGEMVREVLRRGHQLGSRGLRGEKHLEEIPQKDIVASLCEANAIMRDLAGIVPGSLKSLDTQYTDQVREAVYACGIDAVVDSPYNLDMLSFSSFSSVQRYINARALGSIVTMNISEELDVPTQDEKPPEAKPAVDKQETIEPDLDRVDMSLLSANERIMLISEWLIRANAEADFLGETITLKENNEGAKSEALQTIHTTQKAVSFLIAGTGSDEELAKTLDALDTLGAKASFTLTKKLAEENAAQVKLILARGHELLPEIVLQKGADFYTICSRMLLDTEYFKENYGSSGDAVAILGAATDAAAEAASAAGIHIVTGQVRIVQEEDQNISDAQLVMQRIFNNKLERLYWMRGEILRFDRGVYHDEGMLARMLEAVCAHSIYPVKTVGSQLTGDAPLFTYPVPEEEWAEGIDDIEKGHLPTAQSRMEAIVYRYIGTPSARFSDNLPGFTDDERGRIDKKGLIDTKDRVIFLTVDDWGSDYAITQLLDVLEEYDAKATFFVVTRYVESNPNLLRAIAAGGHAIGSHTNEHVQLAVDPEGDMVYESLPDVELEALQDDIIVSWYKLASIIGDMEKDGRPSLVKIFRPPTLAVSRDSMGAVFDLGMKYIVSGSYSTHDYEEEDPVKLYKSIRENMQPGAVVVLHMSDNAKNTAKALEMLFDYNASLPSGKQYTFARLDDYLDGRYRVTPAY